MIQFHVYPGGKKRVVTFSYDDGSPNDARLIEKFNRAGVRGTFHLNGRNYIGYTDEQLAAVRRLYTGHEIACHTVHHGWPSCMPPASLVRETMEDRMILEKIAGYPVIGMSYPSGDYDDGVIAAMRACGIVYSRTTKSTQGFRFPDDYMAWHPTCHHKDALANADAFLANLESEWHNPLFYIWGHSHEFRTEESWGLMDALLEKISGNEKIWYATNGDIYAYVMAQRALIVSADEHLFYNPTAIPVWVERDKKEIFCIPAGERLER